MFRLTIVIFRLSYEPLLLLEGGCAYLGSNMAYSVFAAVFYIHNVTYICYATLTFWRRNYFFLF